jgi:predicted regulator of Ras-like GTPase activity (Roadblock/LC7/MglB family)
MAQAPPAPVLPPAPPPNHAARAPRETDRIPFPGAGAVAPAPPPAVVESLLVSLSALAASWPDAVRKEIVEQNLVDSEAALPVPAVEQGLKQARVAVSWKTVRSWLKPALPPAGSPSDATVLELPLKVVAPIFLERQRKTASPQQKISIDEEIPNLFFGAPPPENGLPGAASAARPTDTNYYVWDESHDTARVDQSEVKRGPTPGTKFVAKYATPNEVVSRAAALDGVNGALIALPDGLMVANRLPPDLNADTLAAFLPQIFGKVSQCTKELRMGELNNLNFTVGNVPWKIFRVNAIFFAAFGRAGEPLPTAQLAALAAELDHRPK